MTAGVERTRNAGCRCTDTRHLFWEEMKRLFFAMRDTEAEDLDDDVMGEFLQAMDGVSNVLHRIEKRRRERLKRQGTDSMSPP